MVSVNGFGEDFSGDTNGNKLDFSEMFRRDVSLKIAVVGNKTKDLPRIKEAAGRAKLSLKKKVVILVFVLAAAVFVLNSIPARWIVGQKEVDRVFPEFAAKKSLLTGDRVGSE